MNKTVALTMGAGLLLALAGLFMGTLWHAFSLWGVVIIMSVPPLGVLAGSVMMFINGRPKQGLVGLFLLVVLMASFSLEFFFFR